MLIIQSGNKFVYVSYGTWSVHDLEHNIHLQDSGYALVDNNWTTKTDVMDEWDFARGEFKMSFIRKPYITQPPAWLLHT